MKFAVTSKEKQFLHKLGFVELAGCLKEDAAASFISSLENAPLRDPHTSIEEVKRLAHKKDFTHLFGELFNQKKIRLLTTAINPDIERLTDLCFQGIVGGFLFTFTSEETPNHLEMTMDSEREHITPCASTPTSLLVLSPHVKLLPPPAGSLSLLVVYGEESSVYFKNDTDPFKTKLRDEGMDYGDAVKDPRHPLIHTR